MWATFEPTDYINLSISAATLLTALASVATAFATMSVVREMSKQRQESHQPILAIYPTSGFLTDKINKSDDLGRFVKWFSLSSGRPEETSIRDVGLKLANIGVGTANDFSAEFEFPMEEFIDAIKKRLEEVHVRVPIKLDTAKVIELLGMPENRFFWGAYRKDFLLPAHFGTNDLLKLPTSWIVAIGLALFASYCRQSRERHLQEINIPPLRIAIEYGDMTGTRHRTAWSLTTRAYLTIQGIPDTQIIEDFNELPSEQRIYFNFAPKMD